MTLSAPTAWFAGDIDPHIDPADRILFYSALLAFFSMSLGTTPMTIGGGLFLAVSIPSGKFFRGFPIHARSDWFRPVWLLFLLPWLALPYSPDPWGMGMDHARKTYYWLFGMALLGLRFDKINPERLIHAFLAGVGLNALVGVLQFMGLVPVTEDPLKGPYAGFGLQYSTASAYLVICILMSSFFFRKAARRKEKIGWVALSILFFLHLSLSRGRAGYVAFAMVSPLIAYNFLHRFGIAKAATLAMALMGLLFLSPVARDRAELTIEQLNHHLHEDPSKAWGRVYSDKQDRFYMWHGAVMIFLDHPLLGVGTGGYQSELKSRGNPDVPEIAHPHNDFLFMAVSYGIPGILALAWLYGIMLCNTWPRREDPLAFFVLSATLVIIASGLMNGQTQDSGMAFLLAMTVGMQAGFSGGTSKRSGAPTTDDAAGNA